VTAAFGKLSPYGKKRPTRLRHRRCAVKRRGGAIAIGVIAQIHTPWAKNGMQDQDTNA
jgi:hypothetical protein